MSEAKFKIGDKVRILDGSKIKKYVGGWIDAMSTFVGQVYTIDGVYFRGGRCYTVKCLPYVFDERALELVTSETIVIYRKNRQVIALDTKTGKKGIAKCNPADEFNFETGAKLAFERLLESSVRYFNGEVVCTKSFGHDLTVGKIYEFKDGYSKDDDGHRLPYLGGPVKSCEELNRQMISKFVELV